MISILIRETLLELPERPVRIIDRKVVKLGKKLDDIYRYCEEKSFKKISGDGVNSIYQRDIDLSPIKAEMKQYFDIKTHLKITERFVINQKELLGGNDDL